MGTRHSQTSGPTLPRPTPTFVGREAELGELATSIQQGSVCVVYGIAGIGKSELVYALLEHLREGAWGGRAPLYHSCSAGRHARLGLLERLAHVLDLPAPSDLDAVVQAMEREPKLVVIEDVHVLDPRELASTLGYVTRRLRDGRVLLTSRLELALPPDCPLPWVTRLGPLDAAGSQKLASLLAARHGVPVPNSKLLWERTRGVPALIRAQVSSESRPTEASIERSEGGALSAGARKLMNLLALSRSPLYTHELRAMWGAPAAKYIAELKRVLWLSPTSTQDKLTLDPLLRERALDGMSQKQRAETHGALARLLRSRWENATDDLEACLEAIEHWIAAREHGLAESFALEVGRRFASAGRDAAVSDLLSQGAEGHSTLTAEAYAFRVRALLRRGRVHDASQEAAPLEIDGIASRANTRLGEAWLLCASGELLAAETRARTLLLSDTPSRERLRAILLCAYAAALRGVAQDAARYLTLAGGLSQAASPRERARIIAMRAWCAAFAGRPEIAAREGAQAWAELSGPITDLHAEIASLEVLAALELGNLTAAEATYERVLCKLPRPELHSLWCVSLACTALAYRRHSGAAELEGLRALQRQFAEQGNFVAEMLTARFRGEASLTAGDAIEAQRCLRAAQRSAFTHGAGALASWLDGLRAEALFAAGHTHAAARACRRAMAAFACDSLFHARAATTLAQVLAAQGALEAARHVLAGLRAEIPERATGQMLAETFIALCGADAARAVQLAERAFRRARSEPDRHVLLEARLALMAALVARARPSDLAQCEHLLSERAELVTSSDHLRMRARVLEAALCLRRGDADQARHLLLEQAATLRADDYGLEACAVRAALDGGSDDALLPGVRNLLSGLGVLGSPLLRDPRSSLATGRASTPPNHPGADEAELLIDVVRGRLLAPGSNRSIDGRRQACSLLARLVAAQGEHVGAETLFVDVWGGHAYHPLRHRNTVYVAINRLRHAIEELLPQREVIETVEHGWRINPEVRVLRLDTGTNPR